MIKIVIAGGSGFLGRELASFFSQKSHQVLVLSRHPRQRNDIKWDGKSLGEWSTVLEDTDVLINLTGRSVDCRYHQKNKEAILSSRIDSTRVLQEAISTCVRKPAVWINASSATAYIHATTQLMDEYNGIIGDDFSMNVCKEWEKEFFKESGSAIRKVAIRTSIVLGNGGGAFPRMKTIAKLGMGGKQASGYQMMSWIHIQDFCRAVEFIILEHSLEGPVNVTAPHPVQNHEFMAALRKALRMPIGLNIPAWLLELGAAITGTETELLTKSRNVYPKKLMDLGFEFMFEVPQEAIKDLLI